MSVIQREVRLGNLDVPVVYEDGQPYVILRPVVNALGLSWTSVFQSVRWRHKFTKHDTTFENVIRPMIGLEASEFLKWLLALRNLPEESEADHLSMLAGLDEVIVQYAKRTFGTVPAGLNGQE